MVAVNREACLFLPEEVIHHILSFLDVQEQVKVSSLTKDWLGAWLTNPNLIFDKEQFQVSIERRHPGIRNMFDEHVKGEEEKEKLRDEAKNQAKSELSPNRRSGNTEDHPELYSLPACCEHYIRKHRGMMEEDGKPYGPICYEHFVMETFAEFVENTSRKYKDHNINRVKFLMFRSRDDMNFVDKCLKIAVEKRVRDVEICIGPGALPKCLPYAIPDFILAAESLTKLSLGFCKVPNAQVINCKNLRELNLDFVWIDDGVFSSLIAGCSLITHLDMHRCTGLKTIKLTNLPCLQHLNIYPEDLNIIYPEGDIEGDGDNVRVQIDAPTLETLYLSFLVRPQVLGRNLRRLRLVTVFVASDFFDNLGDKFPQLQSLEVEGRMPLQKINLTSHSLERLTLILPKNPILRDVKLDVPNLVEFQFIKGIPTVSLRAASSDLPLSRLQLQPTYYPVDPLWFQRVNEMLLNLGRSRIHSLELRGIKFQFQEENKMTRKVPRLVAFPVKFLEIVDKSLLYQYEPINSDFLDVMFLAYRPQAISLPVISWPVGTYGLSWVERNFDYLLKKLLEMQNQPLKGFDIYLYKRDLKGHESEEKLPDWKISPYLSKNVEGHESEENLPDWEIWLPILESVTEIRFQLEWDLFLCNDKVDQEAEDTCMIDKLTIVTV